MAVADIDRILRFLAACEDAVARRRVPFPGGVLLLDDTVPRLWDANLVRLDEPFAGEGEDLGVAVRDASLEAGLGHCMVAVPHEAEARRLARGLRAGGYRPQNRVLMVLSGDPDRAPSAAAEEVPLAATAGVRAEVARAEVWGDDTTVVQLDAWHRHQHGVLDERWLLAYDDGIPGASCRLIRGDGIAQIEDVGTAPEHRGRGLARSVVLGAADRARREGDDLIFLVAEADDWPQRLYRRLGFEEVASLARFRRRAAP